MLKVFFTLSFVFFTLQASCVGSYDSCIQKISDSKSISGETLQIPVTKHTRLIFSRTVPPAKILKSDPFLSLYLVEDTKGFLYPFRIINSLSLTKASVNKNTAIEGKIIKRQIGLNSFAAFSKHVYAPAVLTNICCALEGIVTPDGIIEKEYLERFLSVKNTDYADIGIRVKDEKNGVIVAAADPFLKDNPFHRGDIILFMDAKKVQNSAVLMRDILFAKVGSTHEVKIKRGSQIINLHVVSKKRFSGGYKSDTFLEHYGWVFDKDLTIVKIDKKAHDYGLIVGDRLLRVNGVNVNNQQDIIENISYFKDYVSLLFERENFQFFVNVN